METVTLFYFKEFDKLKLTNFLKMKIKQKQSQVLVIYTFTCQQTDTKVRSRKTGA